MTSNIDFFDHAVELTHRIANQSVPLYIFTSSDARLQLADNGQFAYDPEVSRQLKASRLGSLRTRGLLFKSAFIGDPFDKPTSEFFDSIKSAVTQELGRFHGRDLVVMGDSFSADLNVPLTRWQADLGVWYRRGQEVPQVEGDHVLSIGSWHVLTAILEGQPMSN